MKTFKQVDVWVQSFFMIFFSISSFIKFDYTFITSYFIIGGIQLISIITHHIKRSFQNRQRRIYQFISYVLVAIGCITSLIPWVFLWLFKLYYAMLFVSPVMAIYYLYLCYDETYHHMKRPLAQLK